MNTTTPTPTPPNPGFLREFLGSVKTSVIATLVLAVIVSGVYPLIVWGFAQVLFHHEANGSLIDKNSQPTSNDADAVGSALLAQGFARPEYFHPRSSANGYDGSNSGGSNLGPTSAKLMFGTTKNLAFTLFATEKAPAAVVPVSGRVQGTVVEATKTTITVTATGATAKTTYALDPTVADPNTVVNFHGRTIHAATIAVGANVELKLNEKTPPFVTGINVFDPEIDGTVASVDANANKITLSDAAGTVINVDATNTALIVNGKSGAKLNDIAKDMSIHAIPATVVDFDGIADRVIEYCEANNISYECSIPRTTFRDDDGVDDVKLITAFNAATTPPTITPDPARPIPADAVTASASSLDPHISPANASLQARRVAVARTVGADKAADAEIDKTLSKVKSLIEQYTEGPSLGFLGEAGVNVLRLNLALDKELPVPAAPAAPAATPATAPSTAPAPAPGAQ